MKQLEEKFLNEIKPLVNQFIEIRKQPLDIKQRMECVDIRKEVQSKVSEFIATYKETVNKEISVKTEESKNLSQSSIQDWKRLIQLRDTIIKRNDAIKQAKDGKDENTYDLLRLTQAEDRQKFDKMKQEYDEKQNLYKSSIEQIEELKKEQTEFEERYGDMDYITEKEMYRLDNFMGLKEESKTVRMSDSQVYDENGKVLDMENIMDMEQKADEELEQDREKELEQLREKVAKVFEEKQKEFDEYWEQKVREYDEADKELGETEEINMQEDKKEQDAPKKRRIKTLWEKFTSIFRKREVLRLEEGKEQEAKPKNKFESLKIGAPTQKQQKENAKKFWGKNKEKGVKAEEKQKMEEVLTLLD